MAATSTVAQRSRLRKSPSTSGPITPIIPIHGVVTLFGYGIQIRVERGHLILEDGIGSHRRYGRFTRIGHGIRRLVVVGLDGMISLAALQWLADQKAAFVMLDRDGRVFSTTGPQRAPDARVRRAQSLAGSSEVGLRIARYITDQKLIGQERVIRTRFQDLTIATAISSFRKGLPHARTFEEIRLLESQAGSAYWAAWRDLTISFPAKDASRVPAHWLIFRSRNSPLSGKSARRASNPPNAMLNYLYAVLEAEARLAAIALGLDPDIGVLHMDTAYRANLALDLMEPVRPEVDAFVFDWISRQTLRRDWFFEQPDGNCRLMAELTMRLSETADAWRSAVAPVAEFVTRTLWSARQHSSPGVLHPTPLTQENRRVANYKPEPSPTKAASPPSVCLRCGLPIATGRTFCVTCAKAYSTENIRKAGTKRVEKSNSPDVQAKRAETARRNALAQSQWDPSTQPEWLTQEFYMEHVFPLLKGAPTTAICFAIGVARSSAESFRQGRRMPHPRHWIKLAELVGCSAPTG